MKELEEIEANISAYKSGEYFSEERLIKLLKNLTTNYYFLTKHNIEAYNDWTNIIYNRGDMSVSAAKVKADKEVPQLRQLRKIMEAVDHVINGVKKELNAVSNENK